MKTCFKCQMQKPLSDFYKHSMMADGHLNKCKTCAKRDVSERIELKINDPDWVHKERERCRIKQQRSRRAGTASKASNAARLKWAAANQHKIKAERLAKQAVQSGALVPEDVCENCSVKENLEMHHHDYSRPLAVVWLCVPCHKMLHRKQKGVPVKRRTKPNPSA